MSEDKFKMWSNDFYHRDENNVRILISPVMFGSKTFYFIMPKEENDMNVETAIENDGKNVRTFSMETLKNGSKEDKEVYNFFMSIYEHSKKTLMGSLSLASLMQERMKKEMN